MKLVPTPVSWPGESQGPGSLVVIARPRRFGKSLAVSTLRCLFEGTREYFKGLAIEPEWDWSKKWPVIHLDMGTMQYDTIGELSSALTSYLQSEGRRLGVSVKDGLTVPETFRQLIRAVSATSGDGHCVTSAFRTPTAGSLQSWDRRVRPRLV